MRQLTCTRPNGLEWVEADAPEIQADDDVLVRPVAVARCEIDPLLIGLGPAPSPFSVGHEAVAEVVETGDVVSHVKRGDLVVPSFQISCGRCEPCSAGRTAVCDSYPVLSDYGMASLSGTDYGGMVSDLVRVPHASAMLAPFPANLDPVRVASACDNISDGYRAVAPHLAARPGAAVAVMCHGARSIGLYAAMSAVALGASRVSFHSDDEEALSVAESLGAEPVRTEFGKRQGRWPIVVDCGIRPEGIAYSVASTEPEGVLHSVSYYAEPSVALPLGKMYTLGIEFHIGRLHSAAVMGEVLALLASGRLRPDAVPVTVIDWEDAPARYLDPAVKLVVAR